MNPYEKPDHYSIKAKKEGYPARSIYKLSEINEKFNLIKKKHRVCDLGCAPGSWSMYVSKLVGETGVVVGIDYKKILVSLPNTIFITGDFLSEENQSEISKYSPFNGIISDMAPDTKGDRLSDCFSSSELVRESLAFTYKHLKKGGYFVAKIFQGGEEKEIIAEMKKSFSEAKWFKPQACRKTSFEIFLIGIDFIKPPELNGNTADNYFDNNSGEMPW